MGHIYLRLQGLHMRDQTGLLQFMHGEMLDEAAHLTKWNTVFGERRYLISSERGKL